MSLTNHDAERLALKVAHEALSAAANEHELNLEEDEAEHVRGEVRRLSTELYNRYDRMIRRGPARDG